jgi:hypothetical protein
MGPPNLSTCGRQGLVFELATMTQAFNSPLTRFLRYAGGGWLMGRCACLRRMICRNLQFLPDILRPMLTNRGKYLGFFPISTCGLSSLSRSVGRLHPNLARSATRAGRGTAKVAKALSSAGFNYAEAIIIFLDKRKDNRYVPCPACSDWAGKLKAGARY